MSRIMKLIFLIALFGFKLTYASEDTKSPFKLNDLKLSHNKKQASIDLSLNMEASGDVGVDFSIPESFILKSGIMKSSEGRKNKFEQFIKKWEFSFAEDGYFTLQIKLHFKPANDESEKNRLSEYQSFEIYIEILNGEVTNYDTKPSIKYTQWPIEVNRSENEQKATASYIPMDTTFKNGGIGQKIQNQEMTESTYYITVQISGQIKYNHPYYPYGMKGIPAVGVYLDWDYDDNLTTGYTPYYGGNTLHVDYDISDNNGYYYFSFTFASSQPANYYSQRIRVYANNANAAGYDADLGNGAKMVPLISNSVKIDISGATTSVIAARDLETNDKQGSALRHLYRARQFSIAQLNYTPHQVRYYFRNVDGAFFCQPGNCGGQNINAPRIVFDVSPRTETAYHEYGHFIEYDRVGFIADANYSSSHWFSKETNNTLAWNEGWAEFYAAATHMYWYSVEQPSLPERGSYDVEAGPSPTYQFMDYSQGILFPDRNNKKVEGAVACFFYSLWDGNGLRAPNYTGDNDDISLSAAFLISKFISRYNVLGQLIGDTHIEAYRNALINSTESKYHPSINALYNSLILKSGSALPSTPTSLSVSGSPNSRTLSWNDNTCPSEYTYGIYWFDIIENQEQGFRIYRKATNSVWDGTLNGYSLIGSVGTNVTSWTDSTYLVGKQSYVVVAFNTAGNSRPQVEYSGEYYLPLSTYIEGPSCVNKGQIGSFSAVVSGGTGTNSYQWTRNGAILGTSASISLQVSYDFTLTLTMSSGSQTISTSTPVSVCSGGGGGCDEPLAIANNSNALPCLAKSKTKVNFTPSKFELDQNYPNPFNPSTTISFGIPGASNVTLKIYNMQGQEVRTVFGHFLEAGYYDSFWDGKDDVGMQVASGIYIYRIQAGNFVQSKKMTLIK
ncbi:T9SS type A sorting domain-containing protein [bacterium]|nr:T9SS type A sorting domain-containing protein [bacterium]NUN45406.1 T9SS type A sorting domain-containing protein [bacterium]